MLFLKKILLRLLRILAGVPIISMLAGGLLFFVLSATLKGRCVGLSAIILGGILYVSVGYWNRPWFRKHRKLFFGISIPVGLLLYFVPMVLAPSGGTPQASVRNCFLNGQGHFHSYSPWNVIPEVDQLKVGMHLVPLGDPYVDFARAARMRKLKRAIYADLDKDAEFRDVGSAMGLAYRELFRLPFHNGHYFLFLPEVAEGEQIPCLIFLHGMGGNTKSCLWILSKLSNRMKCGVIAPTFGIGNWNKPESAEFVVSVAKEAIATLPVDPERVFLMGYSNGAMGVTRAALEAPQLFQGLIYLSPITEDELFTTDAFLSHAGKRKMLFLHGGEDERIPLNLVAGTVDCLKRFHCDVRFKVFDGEDHFLLFSQPEAVLDEIEKCMTAEP